MGSAIDLGLESYCPCMWSCKSLQQLQKGIYWDFSKDA